MLHWLKWQRREIALYQSENGEALKEGALLSKIELDFDLVPEVFRSEEECQRLLSALTQLLEGSAYPAAEVHLLLPDSWALTCRWPYPELPAEELAEHIRWELSKAGLASADQYKYNYVQDDDGTLLLVALRTRLFDLIRQIVHDAGLKLSGIFCGGEPWSRVNLLPSSFPHPMTDEPEPVLQEEEVNREKMQKLSDGEFNSGQRPWFFATVLVLGLVAVGLFAWMKLTNKPQTHTAPETSARREVIADLPVDTAVQYEVEEEQRPVRTESREPDSAGLSQYLTAVRQIVDQGIGFDLISLSEDRFLAQISAKNPQELQNRIRRVESSFELDEVQSTFVAADSGLYQGVVQGRLQYEPQSPAGNQPDLSAIIDLAEKYGLKHKALNFTGDQRVVLDFLAEITAAEYVIHRLILVPWGDGRLRASLEL